jgi:HEAT repeat protein
MRPERSILSVAGLFVIAALLFGCAPSERKASQVSQDLSQSPSTESQGYGAIAARTATGEDWPQEFDRQAFWQSWLKKYGVDDFSTEHLIELLDSDLRAFSAELLGERKETSAIPRLEEALNDKSPAVRRAATRALLKMGNRKGIPVLQEYVEGISQEIAEGNWQHASDQSSALRVLADAGEVSAIPHLRKLLKYDRSWGVRMGALRSLTELYEKDPSVSTDIAFMQNDEQPQIRKEASRFLQRTQTRR